MQGRGRHACRGCRSEIRGEVAYEAESFRWFSQAGSTVMRTSMELGGNAPFVVCADADLDRAVEGALGQLKVGDGMEAGIDVGPMIDAAGLEKVQRLVDDAVSRGAGILTGGQPADLPGYFYHPTVLSDVPSDAALMKTEIFGPVAPVIPFDTEVEVVALANDTEWGLVAYLFTQDIDKAFRLGEELEVGMVGLNSGIVSNLAAPLGGIKHSGIGREGGKLGFDEFLEYK